MGNRTRDPHQKDRAYQLHALGRSIPAIAEQLAHEFAEPRDESTIRRWVVKFPAIDEASPDRPFEWHRLDEYGFSWQDGEWFLAMWKARLETAAVVWNMSQAQLRAPTVRHVRWLWRVHQAAPELTEIDASSVASAYERRELRRDLGIEKFDARDLNVEKFDARDLNAFLAFKPWVDEAAGNRYDAAVANDYIPKLRFDTREQTAELAALITKTAWRPEPGVPWPDDIVGRFLTLDTHMWPVGGDTTPEWLLPSAAIMRAWAKQDAQAKATDPERKDSEEETNG